MNSTTTLIAAGIFVVFAIIVIAMMISQARHKALEAKNHRARTLSMQKKRLNNLLRTLPPSFLSNELRDFLYQALIQNLKSQQAVASEKDDSLKTEMEELSAERERVKSEPIPEQHDLLTADQTSVYRGLLKSLYQFVRGSYQIGRLKKDHAEQMLKQVEIKLDETAVDFFTLSAQSFASQNRNREAQNAYQKALSTIDESKHKDQFKQQHMKITNNLNKHMEQWSLAREEASKASADKLASQMESLADEEDSWKKKQAYD